ncbi:MAG: hypothetical protein HRU38_03795 [Saccharospirillaceae bacterium]|nr:hypothetical protein [Pseudomonadales bacterium]NRB77787.1 hypothetical protein [Saccharospirillaceae bacterium]
MSNTLGFSGIDNISLNQIKDNPDLTELYFYDVESSIEDLIENNEFSQVLNFKEFVNYLKIKFNILRYGQPVFLNENWPQEEIDYFICENLNHRNTDLYHEILKHAPYYNKYCNSIFGIDIEKNITAYKLHEEAWCIPNSYIEEIIKCIESLNLESIKKAVDKWFHDNNKASGIDDDEASLFKEELDEFCNKLNLVFQKDLHLIWLVC